jgi:predicted hydrolase (HD superfamily)
MTLPTRAEAWALLCEWNDTERLRKHALAVEAAMRFFAVKHGEDPDVWGLIGLVHDLDFERFPAEHCQHTPRILTERGWPEDWIRAVLAHGFGACTDVEPRSTLEKTLFAIDELTGLVAATALVRPSRSVLDLEARSVLKKWKDPRFAAGVDRAVIERGAAMLGVALPDLITDVILALRQEAPALDLAGNLGKSD